MKIKNNQSGLAHLGLMVVTLFIIGVVGFAIYKVVDRQSNSSGSEGTVSNASDDSAQAIDEVDLETNDLGDVSLSEKDND